MGRARSMLATKADSHRTSRVLRKRWDRSATRLKKQVIRLARMTKKLGSRFQIVGDDLFVTNIKGVEMGIRLGAANALLVKVNQIGTLTETIEAVEKARRAGYGLVMSHRSGETEDTSIADISVGLATGQIKTGAPARGERTCKYNRLIQIEEELGSAASFYGPEFLKKHQ